MAPHRLRVLVAMLQSLILKLFAYMLFFQNQLFRKILIGEETIIVSNSLDPDQA